MKLLPAIFITIAGLMPARADVTMSLTGAVQNSARGATLTFSGTLTNTSQTAEVCLNDVDFSLAGGSALHLAPGTNVFFSNVPGILLPGEAYTGELFEAALSDAAPSGDYAGTITLKGGGDQLAAATLATADFAVLSPAVSIAAGDASASEYGPDAGILTISRTGRTDVPLTVAGTIGGDAVNGVHYQTIAPSAVIPAGAASQVVIISPIPDNLAQGDRTASLTINSSALYNAGAVLSAAVIIHDKPGDAWRFAHFGAAANSPAAADAADWNGDGIANQVSYALNIDPAGSDPAGLPVAILSDGYSTLTFSPNPAAIDMTLTAEASTDLTTWSAADMEPAPGAQPPGQVAFRYRIPFSATPRVFLRLGAQRTLP